MCSDGNPVIAGTPSVADSLRYFASLWMICGFIISNNYVSFLFLFMSELIPRPDVSSIEELAIGVKDGNYVPAASPDGTIFKFIKVT